MKCEKVWMLKPTKSNIFYFFSHTIFLKCICFLAMPLAYYIDVSKRTYKEFFFCKASLYVLLNTVVYQKSFRSSNSYAFCKIGINE